MILAYDTRITVSGGITFTPRQSHHGRGHTGGAVELEVHSLSVSFHGQAGAHGFQADCVLLCRFSLTGMGNWNSMERSGCGADTLLKKQMFSEKFCCSPVFAVPVSLEERGSEEYKSI